MQELWTCYVSDVQVHKAEQVYPEQFKHNANRTNIDDLCDASQQ